MTSKEFGVLPFKTKLEKVVNYKKKEVVDKGSLTNAIFLEDKNGKLHVIPVEDKFLKNEKKEIFSKIIKNIVKDYKEKGNDVKSISYIVDTFFKTGYTDYINVNLDNSFDSKNANESILVYKEDAFEINLEVYDKISIHDQGKTFSIISEKPLQKICFSKLDKEDVINGTLTNLLEF